MGSRLTTPPSSTASSSTTAHRNPNSASASNIAHPRTHSTGNHHHGSMHHRPRSSSGHHPTSHGNRHRTTSTTFDPSSSSSASAAAFNFNILRYVGLEQESDDQSTDEDSPQARRRIQRFLIALRDVSCPVCHKTIPSDSFDKHILQCLSKPRVDYNEDTLTENKGECVICLDDLLEGQKIARLPCLCIYHKSCIDNWFRINRTCPEHPGD